MSIGLVQSGGEGENIESGGRACWMRTTKTAAPGLAVGRRLDAAETMVRHSSGV